MSDLYSSALDRVRNKSNYRPGDYEENGLLMCGRCHTAKQTKRGPSGLSPCLCKCMQEEQRAAEEKAAREKFAEYMRELERKYGVSEPSFRKHTFSADDRKNGAASDVCLQYVQHWEKMLEDGIGLLLYGPVGSGKSFLAYSVVNALLEKRVPAAATNFPRLLNILQSASDRQRCVDHLQSYKLLVIDDLGVERDSPYAMEQIYNIIDSRSRSNLPLIITTNMDLKDMDSPSSMQLQRTYDRIKGMCQIPVPVIGESRRKEIAEQKVAKARDLLLKR